MSIVNPVATMGVLFLIGEKGGPIGADTPVSRLWSGITGSGLCLLGHAGLIRIRARSSSRSG
jgi:hypothetical protein